MQMLDYKQLNNSISECFMVISEGFFCGDEIFQLILSTGKWEGRGSKADTKGNIIPWWILTTSLYEWSIDKHNIWDQIIFHPS